MKNIYENPMCTLIALSSADVITVSGIGEIFNWFDGVKNAQAPGMSLEDN